MKSRAFGPVVLCLCLIAIDLASAASVASAAAANEPNALVTDSPGTDEHGKVLLECQHPDYRTYIKCLKRHKRHHYHGDHDGDGETRGKCFDECGMDQCETTKCVHECHKRCMKKTKETRQIITQYETTCGDSGDCADERSQNLPAANITTNIDINNVIHNHMPNITRPRDGTNTGTTTTTTTTGTQPGPNGQPTNPCAVPSHPNCCSGTPCYGGGGGGGYGGYGGLTLVPQIQFVPQLTFGLGAGGFPGVGGGGWWQHGQTGGVDCSPCANPFLRYRCDVSCYAGTGQAVPNTGRPQAGNPGCTSPQCVGGTII